MVNELHRRQQDERMETLVEIARLDLARHLIRSGTTPLERAEIRARLRDMLQEEIDRDCTAAIDDGETYADVARAVGLTRHGARKRYGHLEAV